MPSKHLVRHPFFFKNFYLCHQSKYSRFFFGGRWNLENLKVILSISAPKRNKAIFFRVHSPPWSFHKDPVFFWVSRGGWHWRDRPPTSDVMPGATHAFNQGFCLPVWGVNGIVMLGQNTWEKIRAVFLLSPPKKFSQLKPGNFSASSWI